MKSFPMFAVLDVALLSVFLEELVNGCHQERANLCLHAVHICPCPFEESGEVPEVNKSPLLWWHLSTIFTCLNANYP